MLCRASLNRRGPRPHTLLPWIIRDPDLRPQGCACAQLGTFQTLKLFSWRLQIQRDMPHYSQRQWSRADLEALQGLSKQLRMYCAKIRAALAPIREAVGTSLNPANSHPSLNNPRLTKLPSGSPCQHL